MSAIVSTNAQLTDADLVTASRSGDRRAFGQIIRKYQAMVSGLIYAACGDLHRSEDVAQETFISAWKSLSGLRDASKLAGWLCQIARRRLADASRKAPNKEISFGQAFAPGQEPVAPVNEALTAEESEVLWQTLARVPQPYRETLVLFYRQEQSTAQVAAAMETTEASVRQRLTRGRQMLRDEVAGMLERNIARTAPNPQFTMQVVAALPALAAQSAGIGATVKGSAAAKSGGLLTIMLGWVAPISVLLSMIYGTWRDIHDARSPRHRSQNKRNWALLWIVLFCWIIAGNGLIHIGFERAWTIATLTWITTIGGTLFGIAFFTVGTVGKWRVDKLLAEEGLQELPFPKLSFAARLLGTAPVVAICLGWMIQMAHRAGDHSSVELISAAIVLISGYLAYRLPLTQPDRPVLHMFETFSLSLFVILVMLNWRLPQWIAAIYGNANVPLWGINLCALVLFVWIAILTVLSRGGSVTNDPRPMTIRGDAQAAQ
jgi:RNA polymerase sigma factor (sigma-70 family)